MKVHRRLALLLGLSLATAQYTGEKTQAAEDLASRQFIESLPMDTGPYKPSWQSIASQYQIPNSGDT